MSKRIYISGAISSVGQLQAKAIFGVAEDYLRAQGYTDIVNPCVLCPWVIDNEEKSPMGHTLLRVSRILCNGQVEKMTTTHEALWQMCMEACLRELLSCEVIYMLNNWKQSRGARVELAVAVELGLQVIFQSIASIQHL